MALSCYLSDTYRSPPPPGGFWGHVGMPGPQVGAGRLRGPGPYSDVEANAGIALAGDMEAAVMPARTTIIVKTRNANFISSGS